MGLHAGRIRQQRAPGEDRRQRYKEALSSVRFSTSKYPLATLLQVPSILHGEDNDSAYPLPAGPTLQKISARGRGRARWRGRAQAVRLIRLIPKNERSNCSLRCSTVTSPASPFSGTQAAPYSPEYWWTAPESNRAPRAALWPLRASTACAARRETRHPHRHEDGGSFVTGWAGICTLHGSVSHYLPGSPLRGLCNDAQSPPTATPGHTRPPPYA